MGGIYAIKNRIDGKVYIGKSVDIEKRWYEHKRTLNIGTHINIHLQRAWRKYGQDSFTFSVLAECDADTLNTLEIELIAQHNATNRKSGYNLTHGGEGEVPTVEVKAKMSASQKTAWEDPNSAYKTEEFKAKHSASIKKIWENPAYKAKQSANKSAQRQDPNSVYNTEEYKAKKSVSMKTYYQDPVNRAKTGEAIKLAMADPKYRAYLKTAMRTHYSTLNAVETDLLADGSFNLITATATKNIGAMGKVTLTVVAIKAEVIGMPIVINVAGYDNGISKVKILDGINVLFSDNTIKSISAWLSQYLEEPDMTTAIEKLIRASRFQALNQIEAV